MKATRTEETTVPVMPCGLEFLVLAGELHDGTLHFPVHTEWTFS